MKLWNNRSYFGSEIWDTNAPGYKQVQQALKHIVGSQLEPMSVSGMHRAQDTGGRPIESLLPYLGFGPAPKYAEQSALQNRIGYLYREHVAPAARPYRDGAVTQAQQSARNNLLLAKQHDSGPERAAAVQQAVKAGLTQKYIAEALQGVASDQKMFRRLPHRQTR